MLTEIDGAWFFFMFKVFLKCVTDSETIFSDMTPESIENITLYALIQYKLKEDILLNCTLRSRWL